MIGLRTGLAVGLRVGVAAGLSEDEITAPTGGGIVGVTRDATNGNYFPANAAEWTLFRAAVALPAGNPTSVWNLQEPSGNPADAIGTVTLIANSITLYQQPMPGATRKCIRGVDGTANSNLRNTTTAANPSLTSCLLLAFVDLPTTPAAIRDVIALATNSDVRYNATGKLRLFAGANADLANAPGASQRWIALRSNLSASSVTVFTDQEKFIGTFVAPTNAAHVALGGDNAAMPAAGFAYACEFTGAAAEMSDAQVKTMLQGLGATIPWS